MSLIHEALEKVEQGKKADETKLALDTAVEEFQKESLSRPDARARTEDWAPRILYGVGAVLLVLFLAGVISLGVRSMKTGKSGARSQGEPSPVLPPGSSPVRGLGVSPSFSLTGITRVGGDRTAIVNNELVRVGDWVSGAQVERIGGEEVVLAYRGETIELSLHRER